MWMNDPCAPSFHGSLFHLFFQYNPLAPYWGPMHWGHAVSPDLAYWHVLPVALSPRWGTDDWAGAWTGSWAGGPFSSPVLLFTGVWPEMQLLARPFNASDPELRSWSVSASPWAGFAPSEYQQGFRDPTEAFPGALVGVESEWVTAIGSGASGGGGGAVLLYAVPGEGGEPWGALGTLRETTDPSIWGAMWECPDVYALNASGALLLKVSSNALGYGDHYSVFSHFSRDDAVARRGVYDFGQSWYASKSFTAPDGERVLFGWLKEEDDAYIQRGWAGMQSLPRVVRWDTRRLRTPPAPALRALRRMPTRFAAAEISLEFPGNGGDGNFTLPRRGAQWELGFRVPFGEFPWSGLAFRWGSWALRLADAPPARAGCRWDARNFSEISPSPSPADCARRCAEDEPLCLAWSYARAGARCALIAPRQFYQNGSASTCLPEPGAAAGVTASMSVETPLNAVAGGAVVPLREEDLDLVVFADRSVVEVFAQGGERAATVRVYPVGESGGWVYDGRPGTNATIRDAYWYEMDNAITFEI